MKIPRLSVPEVRRRWRRSAVLVSWFAISIVMLFFPMDAKAFKAETHVWVAQQVLNDLQEDLEDGSPLKSEVKFSNIQLTLP